MTPTGRVKQLGAPHPKGPPTIFPMIDISWSVQSVGMVLQNIAFAQLALVSELAAKSESCDPQKMAVLAALTGW